MLKFNQKNTGFLVVGLAIVLVFMLAIVKADVDKRDSALCEVFHSNPDLDIAQCPAHQSNTSWFLMGAFGIAFLILGSGLYMIFIPASKEERKFEADASKLDEEEKKVYEILKANNGSAYQSDVIKEAGFSKVKISRILDRMEAKGVAERKRRGMTNLIVLK
jgi:uncharacterized membrane protein